MTKLSYTLLVASLLTASAAFADQSLQTLETSENSKVEHAYDASKNTEFFTYLGLRGGLTAAHLTDSDYTEVDRTDNYVHSVALAEDYENIFGSPFIGVGYRWGRLGARVEAEWIINNRSANLGPDNNYSIKNTAVMGNIYGDIYATPNSVFFAMVGVGQARVNLHTYGYAHHFIGNRRDNNVAYHIGVGGQYYFVDHFGLEGGLRWYDYDKTHISNPSGNSLNLEHTGIQAYVGAIARF